jgi:hypothetical protein
MVGTSEISKILQEIQHSSALIFKIWNFEWETLAYETVQMDKKNSPFERVSFWA